MKKNKFIDQLEKTFKECLEIAKIKNADYANEDDAFKNFKGVELVGVDARRGILVRIVDKISRISNLLDRKEKVKDEKIEDTIKDLINYANILLALIIELDKKK